MGNHQSKFSLDRQDIIEFLNIKVREHEHQIQVMRDTVATIQQEKIDIENTAAKKVATTIADSNEKVESMAAQIRAYKAELEQLSEFKSSRDLMANQILALKTLLETRERENKEMIHTMERKILQDKNSMKKEMLQKVNEAVANFRRVADQQMAEVFKV